MFVYLQVVMKIIGVRVIVDNNLEYGITSCEFSSIFLSPKETHSIIKARNQFTRSSSKVRTASVNQAAKFRPLLNFLCGSKHYMTDASRKLQWKLNMKINLSPIITYPISSSSRLFRLTPVVVFARISTKICGNFSTMQINSVEKLAACNKVSDCIFVCDRFFKR